MIVREAGQDDRQGMGGRLLGRGRTGGNCQGKEGQFSGRVRTIVREIEDRMTIVREREDMRTIVRERKDNYQGEGRQEDDCQAQGGQEDDRQGEGGRLSGRARTGGRLAGRWKMRTCGGRAHRRGRTS